MSILQIIIIGALGGFLNCILFYDGFLIPSLKLENGKKLKPGFIGNIILGAAGGFVLYAFVAQELAGIKQIALVFLGGIGGGNVLISFLQKHKIGVEERRTEGFEKLAEEIIKAK